MEYSYTARNAVSERQKRAVITQDGRPIMAAKDAGEER